MLKPEIQVHGLLGTRLVIRENDPHIVPALYAYANSCKETDPATAKQMIAWAESLAARNRETKPTFDCATQADWDAVRGKH